MSYPSFVAASPLAFGVKNSKVLVQIPQGSQSKDLLLVFLESANEPPAVPSGWSIVPNSAQGVGSPGTAGAVAITALYKFASSLEKPVTFDASGDHLCGISAAFRNVDEIFPFSATSGGIQPTASTTLSLPPVTTTRSQCLIVHAVATDNDANTSSNFTSWVNPMNTPTEQFDRGTNLGAGGGIGIATFPLGVAGPSGITTVSQPSGTAAYLTLAIGPARRVIIT